LSKFKYF